MFKALQFIGTQRSGSNLLRVMLHQHPMISAPHPPHILQVMMPLLPLYGDLNVRQNFDRLTDDVCTLVELNPVSWNVSFDRDDVQRRCSLNSLPQLMKAVYEVKAETKGASIWCCKSMASIHYISEIENSGIHPFYIFIHRDGRDVAASFRKAIVGEKHIWHLAQQWKEEQRLSFELCRKVGSSRCAVIRYDDLLNDPALVLQQLCEKIGIPYDEQMLRYTESEESKNTASSGEMWSNLTQPVIRSNSGKYRKSLTAEEISLFEFVAEAELKMLGYELQHKDQQQLLITEDMIRSFDEQNRQLTQNAKTAAAPKDLEARRRQDEFISGLKQHLNAER